MKNLNQYLLEIGQVESRRQSKRIATEALQVYGEDTEARKLIQESTMNRKLNRNLPLDHRHPWSEPGGGCPGMRDCQGWEP